MGKDKDHEQRRSGKETEPFVLMRRSLLHSPQFAALSTPARALVLELHAMYNGTNNGTVFLSVRDAAARLGFSDLKAASRAFHELIDLGWITETIGASFEVKADSISRARAWQLNWIDANSGRCAGPQSIPPLDFGKLSATQKRRVRGRQLVLEQYLKDYQSGRFAVEDSSTVEARKAMVGQSHVGDSSTLKSGNGGNPPNPVVEENTTHIGTIPFADRGPSAEQVQLPRENADCFVDQVALRAVVLGHWRGLRTAARRRSWAASHGITDETVKEYITGNPGALPLDKQAELVATIKAEKKAKRIAARIPPAPRARTRL